MGGGLPFTRAGREAPLSPLAGAVGPVRPLREVCSDLCSALLRNLQHRSRSPFSWSVSLPPSAWSVGRGASPPPLFSGQMTRSLGYVVLPHLAGLTGACLPRGVGAVGPVGPVRDRPGRVCLRPSVQERFPNRVQVVLRARLIEWDTVRRRKALG